MSFRKGLLLFACVLGLALAPALAGADLSRLVVVGDSLSAGYMNGSLLDRQQEVGYAAFLARMAGTNLDLPLIGWPGIPNVMTLDPGPPPALTRVPGQSPGRIDPMLQVTNLAVPGQDTRECLELRPDLPIDSMTDLVLGLPGLYLGVARSQVEWAEALEPTTIVLWIGNNDLLGAAVLADPAYITPFEEFAAAYSGVVDRLAATGAALVIANLPDVKVIPYLTSWDEIAFLTGLGPDQTRALLGVGPGDFVTMEGMGLVQAILAGEAQGPLPPNMVLTAEEAAVIDAAAERFNAFIAEKAAEVGAALVDIFSLTRELDATGYTACGRHLTSRYLGGIFSLDGVHPTASGYAIVANEFIRAMNEQLGAMIPEVPVCRVIRNDPLAPRGYAIPASMLPGHGSEEAAQGMKRLFAR